MQELRHEEKIVLKLLEIDEIFLQKKAVGLPAEQVSEQTDCSCLVSRVDRK